MKMTSGWKVVACTICVVAINTLSDASQWNCITYGGGGDVIIIAKADEKNEVGEISVSGVVHKTRYKVFGFDRRFDFGLNSKFEYEYAFIIKPDGQSYYYDFNLEKKASWSMHLYCKPVE